MSAEKMREAFKAAFDKAAKEHVAYDAAIDRALAAVIASQHEQPAGYSREWCERMAKLEGGMSITAGVHAKTVTAPSAQGDDGWREFLGKYVRMVWIEWAREQQNPKRSWFLPWDELTEPEREVDRRIGERIAALVRGVQHEQAAHGEAVATVVALRNFAGPELDWRGPDPVVGMKLYTAQPAPAVPESMKDIVRTAIAGALGDAYDCTRVWQAWSYGTMSADDFSLVAEDSDRLNEITEAVFQALPTMFDDACDAAKYRALNTPEIADFLVAIEREALHQRERHGADHDAGKSDFDWVFLLGHLATRSAMYAKAGNPEKALHHIITSAAVCLNWHAAKIGAHTGMRPGIAGATS